MSAKHIFQICVIHYIIFVNPRIIQLLCNIIEFLFFKILKMMYVALQVSRHKHFKVLCKHFVWCCAFGNVIGFLNGCVLWLKCQHSLVCTLPKILLKAPFFLSVEVLLYFFVFWSFFSVRIVCKTAYYVFRTLFALKQTFCSHKTHNDKQTTIKSTIIKLCCFD